MKLSMLGIAQRRVAARERLLQDIERAETEGVAVSIGAALYDDALSAVVRPIVVEQLRLRIESLERELRSYGVQID